MTVSEARALLRSFNQREEFTEEEEYAFVETLEFLIHEEHDPRDMMYLGGHYYEKQLFDLALKYYEMAAAMDYDEAYECLGYVWYYGRTGEKDYEKAFRYFQKLREKGHFVATYKVADMYKNGYYVEKNVAEYERIIEELYPRVAACRNVFDPIPEVFTRLAKIRAEQGRKEEAVELYLKAKRVLAQRIQYNAFFGNLSIMKYLITDLYRLIPFDEEDFDFFDLYYLLQKPHKVSFRYAGKQYDILSEMDGNACAICFEGKWYRGPDEFYGNACIDKKQLTGIFNQFYGFETD